METQTNYGYSETQPQQQTQEVKTEKLKRQKKNNNPFKINHMQNKNEMNVRISKDKNGTQTVLASELYNFLEPKAHFKDWIKRMLNYGYKIDFDYWTFQDVWCSNLSTKNKRGGHNAKDYILTLDCAKSIAMLQRSEKGKKIREYFIACEKIAINQDNSVIEALKQRISFYERIEQIKQIRIQLNKEIKQLRQFIETPPQIIQPVLKQLTLNFPEYEN
ncbi:hypothetical protein B0A56_01845 [Flavobacterium columnare NBRC 100251 = ATCC 23463]|nr:hypothetical protein B0A56_01845 [Flavobacterium columnare NBRC 100251 = ATCC 23463]